MKNKNQILKKILCMFFVVVCCLSCFNFSVFADEGNYGEAPAQNIIPLPNGTGPTNDLFVLPVANRNIDTMIFLMDYMQYLYSYNMTNGQKPFLIVCTASAIDVYCVPVAVGNVYVNSVDSNTYNERILFNVTRQDYANAQMYQLWRLLDFGNFEVRSVSASSSGSISSLHGHDSSAYVSYIYLNQDGTYSYYAYNAETSGVYFPLLDMYFDMKTFINDSYVSVPGEETGVVLDIGSIITSVMTAPMIVFGGLTGTPGDLSQSLNLFGVDIRAALISILVIAIVVFIIKFLRGG